MGVMHCRDVGRQNMLERGWAGGETGLGKRGGEQFRFRMGRGQQQSLLGSVQAIDLVQIQRLLGGNTK